jgi:hypothetical protein
MDLMTQWTEISTRYSLEEILQQKKGLERRSDEKSQPAAFHEDVTQTLERFDPEAQAIKKNDVKFYGYLIGTTILHDRSPCLYKEARSNSSFASGSNKTNAGARPQHLGRGSTKNNPCLRSGLKLKMECLEVLKAQLIADVRREATPFMSAETLLKMRERRFCNQGEKRERLLL